MRGDTGENSWSLGTCSSEKLYDPYNYYIQECCLNEGLHTLKCMDSKGDGWAGGFIRIQGNRYCEDFNSGSQKEIEITIRKSGK